MKSHPVSEALNWLYSSLVWLCGTLGMLVPVGIIGFLIIKGAPSVSPGLILDYPRGFPLGTEGGIGPAISGSLLLGAIGFVVAVPSGILSGIYLSEFTRSVKIRTIIRFFAEILAGIPSIIYGLFGYAFFVVLLRTGTSLLAGGLVLGIIMYPVILLCSFEAFRSIDDEYREAALAAGVDRWYLIRTVLIKKAWPGIVSGIVLALGHAIGSAAPVLFTASVYFSKGDISLFNPVMTLPTHLYFLVSEAISFEQAYATALVLITGLLLSNILALWIRSWGSRHA
jgi:phosphate transport system permease protein